jgi:hypothetical protein
MHGRSKQPRSTGPATIALGHPSGAVTWIDSTRAVIARTAATGGVSVEVVPHQVLAGTAPYLARVVDGIGDRDRILILGPDAMRVELEREYVTIYHRPDRLLDVEASGPTEQAELVRRLEVLTGD